MIINSYRYAGGAAPTFDADYQAVLDYATAQGYTLPSAAWQAIENQLMIDLKASGAFAKMVYFRNYRGNGDLDYKCINWKNPGTYNATRVNSLVVDNNLGFASDGTSYLMTGVDQLDSVLTDRRIGFFGGFNTIVNGTTNQVMIGAQASFALRPYGVNGLIQSHFNALENVTGAVELTAGAREGLHILHRNGSTDYTWWIDGVKEGENTTYTSTRYFARDLLELAANNSSTIGSPLPVTFFIDPVACTFLGNQALSDTEKINLSASVNTYMLSTP